MNDAKTYLKLPTKFELIASGCDIFVCFEKFNANRKLNESYLLNFQKVAPITTPMIMFAKQTIAMILIVIDLLLSYNQTPVNFTILLVL